MESWHAPACWPARLGFPCASLHGCTCCVAWQHVRLGCASALYALLGLSAEAYTSATVRGGGLRLYDASAARALTERSCKALLPPCARHPRGVLYALALPPGCVRHAWKISSALFEQLHGAAARRSHMQQRGAGQAGRQQQLLRCLPMRRVLIECVHRCMRMHGFRSMCPYIYAQAACMHEAPIRLQAGTTAHRQGDGDGRESGQRREEWHGRCSARWPTSRVACSALQKANLHYALLGNFVALAEHVLRARTHGEADVHPHTRAAMWMQPRPCVWSSRRR